jgi:hypothetical protein
MITFVGLVGETYIRFLVVETDAYGASLVAKRWHRIYPKLNSLYCWDHEWTEQKPPGVYRIAFVGDSFTFGWGINDRADRFTDLIQARFDRERDRQGADLIPSRARQEADRGEGLRINNRQSEIGDSHVEVMNVAWAAWDTPDERRAIRDMIEYYDIDEVVLCYLPNDVESLLPVVDGFDPKDPPGTWLVNLESSFLLDYLFHRVYAPRVYTGRRYGDWIWQGYHDPKLWARQRDALQSVVDLCNRRRVTLRAVLLPAIRNWGGEYDAAQVHQMLTDYFTAQAVPVADLRPAIAGLDPMDLVVNRFDPHPNESTHRLFAEAIWTAFYAHAAP